MIAKDGTIITPMGNIIHCTDGEQYMLIGSILKGPQGITSMNVGSIEEAVGIVVGLHGGKKI